MDVQFRFECCRAVSRSEHGKKRFGVALGRSVPQRVEYDQGVTARRPAPIRDSVEYRSGAKAADYGRAECNGEDRAQHQPSRLHGFCSKDGQGSLPVLIAERLTLVARGAQAGTFCLCQGGSEKSRPSSSGCLPNHR